MQVFAAKSTDGKFLSSSVNKGQISPLSFFDAPINPAFDSLTARPFQHNPLLHFSFFNTFSIKLLFPPQDMNG